MLVAVLVETVTTRDLALLDRVRMMLREADEVLLCVAFADRRGVGLIERELESRQQRAAATRLLVTTVFGTTQSAALAQAQTAGVEVRRLNPGGHTYHPKVYLGIHGARMRAVVGSANLTAGLATNLEAAVFLDGTRRDRQLREAWEWAEGLWQDPRTEPFVVPGVAEQIREEFEPPLRVFLANRLQRSPEFRTLRTGARNILRSVEVDHVLLETDQSRRRGPPERVDAWMFQLAVDYLRSHPILTYDVLTNDLRVHRSSAVLAILADYPAYERAPGQTAIRARTR
jgi:HKD family nuclease